MTSANIYPYTSIGELVERQSVDMGWDNFICTSCRNYKGRCVCEKGVFIAFVGGNMRGCIYYRLERRKRS